MQLTEKICLHGMNANNETHRVDASCSSLVLESNTYVVDGWG
jgi:hypothetical protein